MATSRILDQNGTPIERAVLSEPQSQASNLAWLHRNWELHPTDGMTPQRLNALLRGAETGELSHQLDLYADMEDRDGNLLSLMDMRKRALKKLPCQIVAPENPDAEEKSATDFLTDQLKALPVRSLTWEMADGIGKGFAMLEHVWSLEEGTWITRPVARPQRWFRLDIETRMELRLRDLSMSGAPLWPFGWIKHLHPAKSGYMSRQALYRTLVWPYMFQFFSLRDLAEFLDIYGLPIGIGTYPSGSSDDEKADLLRALVGIGHNARGIVPEGMLIDFKEAAKGQSDPFMLMIDWCERVKANCILGAMGTRGTDGKTASASNERGDIRQDVRDSDAELLGESLTRDWAIPVLILNGFQCRRWPKVEFDTTEPEDFQMLSEALPKLVGVGVQIPATWPNAKLKIPVPQDGEAVLTIPTQETIRDNLGQPGAKPAPVAASHLAALAAPAPAVEVPDLVDVQTARLANDARPAMAGMVSVLERTVVASTDFEDLRNKLLGMYGHLDHGDLAQVMAQAFTAANAAGRFEAGNGR